MVRKLVDKKSSRKRSVGTEEAELWASITGDVKPLGVQHHRVVPEVSPKPTLLINSRALSRDNGARGGFGAGVGAHGMPSTVSRAVPSRQLPGKQSDGAMPAALDRKNLRRIGKGRISIDDRIDLHGMFQGPAHFALLQFLRRCQMEHFKNVLVITGKGRLKTERSEDWMNDREVGVLRREVPNWLKSDELQDVVVGYSNALPQHGGSGALYVRLKRLR